MKKLSIFAVLALLVLGLAGVAQAADIKASGKWQIDATWRENNDFLGKGGAQKDAEEQSMNIEQRMRVGFQFIANENLKGVLELQIGTENWGQGLYQIGAGRSAGTSAATGANTAGNGNVMLRKGYIDFKWPGTKVNFLVGFQGISLPAAFGGGSAILDDQMAAAVVSTPLTDNLKLLAGYARISDSQGYSSTTTGANAGSGTSADAVFAALPISLKGFDITPFAAYANVGYQSGVGSSLAGFAGPNSSNQNGLRGYWGGVAFTMTAFDPFKLMADFNYGKVSYNNGGGSSDGGRSGYLFDVALDYTGLSMMTPEVFFAYSSGEGGNSTQKDSSGRMPVIANPQGWTVNNSFFFGDRDFINGFGKQAGYARNVMGFWTAGVSLKNIKLIDKLTHNVNLLYIKGTNDADYLKESGGSVRGAAYGAFLTTKDSLWEVDLNSKYQIYDELSLALNLGYINADLDKDTWSVVSTDYRDHGSKDAYRVGLALNYVF